MSDILVSQDGSVLQIELNRPAKKNALTLSMYEALISALRAAGAQHVFRSMAELPELLGC